jgi:hypothetical protein
MIATALALAGVIAWQPDARATVTAPAPRSPEVGRASPASPEGPTAVEIAWWGFEHERLKKRERSFMFSTFAGFTLTGLSSLVIPLTVLGCSESDASCVTAVIFCVIGPSAVVLIFVGGIGWGVTHSKVRKHDAARPRLTLRGRDDRFRMSLAPGGLQLKF